ncbi:7659_t:CDS:2, partial [Ambispora gerdemannii]
IINKYRLSMNSFKAHTLLSRTHSIALSVRLFQSQVGMFKLTRSRQLVLIRPYNSSQEKETQAEKGLKKYWNSFKTVVTDPSKKLASKKVLYTMGIGLVISYLYFTHESPRAQDKKMADVFKKGKIDREFNPTKLVKRENLENALKEILQLSFQRYFLISGEHGTGKTTLVQNTILNLQEPKGVIHFECPSDVKEFAKKLSKQLDCELYPFKLRDIIVQLATNAIRKGSTWYVEQDGYSEYSNWDLLSMQLLRTANYYMKKYKRPIVLILDQVDRIAKEDPKFLRILQDFAKDCADKGTLVIVFIASEGLVPQIMKSRSAWSRASTPFEVGDISDEEAVKFLQDSGIDKKKAEDAVKYLTGGRFTLLKEVQLLNRVNPKNLVEKFKEQMFTQIKRDLDTVELPANHEFFIKLIEVDHIDIQKAKTVIPLNMIHKLVEANILKENQDYTVSFHSRYIDTYFKEVILADDVVIH